MKALPDRSEIIAKIEGLIEGSLTRENVAAWADSIILDDDVELSDKISWDVLGSLGMADAIGLDRPYLFGQLDFEAWLKQLTYVS